MYSFRKSAIKMRFRTIGTFVMDVGFVLVDLYLGECYLLLYIDKLWKVIVFV